MYWLKGQFNQITQKKHLSRELTVLPSLADSLRFKRHDFGYLLLRFPPTPTTQWRGLDLVCAPQNTKNTTSGININMSFQKTVIKPWSY